MNGTSGEVVRFLDAIRAGAPILFTYSTLPMAQPNAARDTVMTSLLRRLQRLFTNSTTPSYSHPMHYNAYLKWIKTPLLLLTFYI